MLLATSLDGSFLAGKPDARLKLYQIISRHPDIRLTYVTGRGLEAVLPILADPTLPRPDYLICDVGATIVDGNLQPMEALQSDIDARWPGEHTVVARIGDFPGLARQHVPQTRRVSYFCAPEAITADLRELVRGLGCEIAYSQHRFLDILPAGVNKGDSLKKLVEHLGVGPDDVLVVGWSMNDLAMFRTGFKCVCVGNAEPELQQATAGSARVLQAARHGCGAILEAMAHFGFVGEKALTALAAQEHYEGESELVLVYHRLPYEEVLEKGRIERRRPRSPNGIIPSLLNFFGDGRKGSWVAWSVHEPGNGEFESLTAVDAERFPQLTAARVPLSKEEVDIFYRRFSKEAFWPLLHTFWERATFREDHWRVFCKVNRDFAEAAAREAAPGAIVWLHDYNLWMVPAALREMRPDVKIAFFHHTHFPSTDIFSVVPWRRQIVGSLLQCDYVGFHIPRQVENFIDVVRGTVPIDVLERRGCAPRFLTYGCAAGVEVMTTAIRAQGRLVRLGAHPVGLDVDRVRAILRRDEVQQRMATLRAELHGLRLILSVERLDYTKGTLEKLLAFERLLEQRPELAGKVTLITICVPAAAEITIYDTLQTHIEQAVGRINGRFSCVGWTPVQFFFRAFPFEELVAYYAMADVMWITTLRDGLNLVAKEYVASQGLTGGRGVLVLSEFAGAAAELKSAVLTNPHDPIDLVETIYLALAMSHGEAETRMRSLFETVQHYDLRRWGEEFLAAVAGEALDVERPRARPVPLAQGKTV